jgi:hypothetical protein
MNTYPLAVFVGLHIPMGYIILIVLAFLAVGYYLGKKK